MDNDFTPVKSYYWADDQNIAVTDHSGAADETYYNLHDRLGSVRLVLNAAGAVVNRFDYDPYGNVTQQEFAATDNYTSYHRFANYKWDETVGMYDCNARWYDPVMMRFTGRDPVRGGFDEPLSLHRYLYCVNEPVNKVDKDGKWAAAIGGEISGNFSFNDYFGGEMQNGLNGIYKSIIGESFAQIMAYTVFLVPYQIFAASEIGGNAGGAFVVAKDESKDITSGWSFGWMKSVAGGMSKSSSNGGSAGITLSFSRNAQHVSHLSGGYMEAGGSVTLSNRLSISGSYGRSLSKNDETGNYIDLWTIGVGCGTTPGWELHGYVGHAWVDEINW